MSDLRNVRVTLRRRVDPAAAARAIERWSATRPKGSVGLLRLRSTGIDLAADGPIQAGADLTHEHVEHHRLWLAAPLRWRYELEIPGQGIAVARVVDGERSWFSWPRDAHAEVVDAGNDHYPFRDMFEPHIDRGSLRETGHAEVAGHAVPLFEFRSPDRPPLQSLPPGAEVYELAIDEQRGVILRARAVADGTVLVAVEVTEIEFDAKFPEETFTLGPDK